MRKNHAGIGAGLAVLGIIGASALFMNSHKMRKTMNKRAVKKNVNKAIRNVSSFVDEVGNIIK